MADLTFAAQLARVRAMAMNELCSIEEGPSLADFRAVLAEYDRLAEADDRLHREARHLTTHTNALLNSEHNDAIEAAAKICDDAILLGAADDIRRLKRTEPHAG